jgi:hypothetical protein
VRQLEPAVWIRHVLKGIQRDDRIEAAVNLGRIGPDQVHLAEAA